VRVYGCEVSGGGWEGGGIVGKGGPSIQAHQTAIDNKRRLVKVK